MIKASALLSLSEGKDNENKNYSYNVSNDYYLFLSRCSSRLYDKPRSNWVSPRTYKWYEFNFLDYLRNSKPINKNGKEVEGRPTLSDRYIHGYAGTIRTLLKFCYEEHYIQEPVKFKMPPIRRNKLPVLEIEDITKLFNVINSSRDIVLVTLAIASGMRLSEIVALNWGELYLRKGRIDVLQGKGQKYRTVVINKDTLFLVNRYNHELQNIDETLVSKESPVIQIDEHERFTPMGIRSIFIRLADKPGIHFSAHALRRTFARMEIKNGMDIVWLQTLLGHANLKTTRDYVQGLDIEDVDKAYQEHAPLKGLIRGNKHKNP